MTIITDEPATNLTVIGYIKDNAPTLYRPDGHYQTREFLNNDLVRDEDGNVHRVAGNGNQPQLYLYTDKLMEHYMTVMHTETPSNFRQFLGPAQTKRVVAIGNNDGVTVWGAEVLS